MHHPLQPSVMQPAALTPAAAHEGAVTKTSLLNRALNTTEITTRSTPDTLAVTR
ncbi:hypothetical protein RKD30_007294 [Streptomyces pristinaespiralis]